MFSESYQRLSCSSQFLTNYSPKNYLNRLLLTRNMLAQSIIDKGLVTPATCHIHFATKPFQNISINADGEFWFSPLPQGQPPAFAFTKVMVSFHSKKSSNTRTSINSCNLDNLLSFVRNAFAPQKKGWRRLAMHQAGRHYI